MKNKNKFLITNLSIIIILVIGVAMFYDNNKEIQVNNIIEKNNNVIPKLLNYNQKEGKFTINENTKIYVKGNNESEDIEINSIAELLKKKIEPATGYTFNIIKGNESLSNSIYLTTIGGKEELGNEGYEIEITEYGVKITAYNPEGLFRGIQTIRQLLPPEIEKLTLVNNVEWSLPISSIYDKPEYSYRGLMIDVARHFFTEEEIKKQIDYASQYKINRVHLHLSDDQGWRIEI